MLKYLFIHNIVLVEQARIDFSHGLNIITGETGSGKSAIMHALRLLCGERADYNLLRHGCEKGWIEAAFELLPQHQIFLLLDEAGISYSTDEPLILKRELTSSAKNRIFINNQLAQRNLLQKIASHLVQIVGQNSSRDLLQPEWHRDTLDIYGSLEEEATAFAALWQKEKKLKQDLENLLNNEQERLRTMDTLQREIEELTEAQLKEGEEEELFAEYSLLSNAEMLSSTCQDILTLLQNDQKGVLTQLHRAKRHLEKLAEVDSSQISTFESLSSSLLEIQEVAHSISNYACHVDQNPSRAAWLNDRLSLISNLKKRYGADIHSMLQYLSEATQKLKDLEHCDDAIDLIQEELAKLAPLLNTAAAELTTKRHVAAGQLAQELTAALKELNMPYVEIQIDIQNAKRSIHGDDYVEWMIQPNKGEKMVPLRQCASGGEISRILLALHFIMSDKDKICTIVFDEIDANIGGQTATLVGEKLRAIGQNKQVFCITHFPQVAAQAHHHLQISKSERDGRTYTTVAVLSEDIREKELARMAGTS